MELVTKTLELHPTVVDSIRAHSQREQAKGGYEAVGFVASKYKRSLGVAAMPLHNHSPDPQHNFFVEPWEQYRAERKLEQQGYEILAVYHSHPNSEPKPSGSDHALAWPGQCVLIYSVLFDELEAYKESDGNLEPIELVVKEG